MVIFLLSPQKTTRELLLSCLSNATVIYGSFPWNSTTTATVSLLANAARSSRQSVNTSRAVAKTHSSTSTKALVKTRSSKLCLSRHWASLRRSAYASLVIISIRTFALSFAGPEACLSWLRRAQALSFNIPSNMHKQLPLACWLEKSKVIITLLPGRVFWSP